MELDAGEAIPDLRGFDLMVAMGGPMDVWQEALHPWLGREKGAIRTWVGGLKKPYLGICLGHQLLADALGGHVALMSRPEVGLATVDLTPAGQSDRLLAGLGPTMETLQWHGAEISKLPAGATVLAANSACPVQAIRWGRHAYGFQYHVEITASTVPEWAEIPEYRSSLKRSLGEAKIEEFQLAVANRLAEFRRTAQRIDQNLWSLISATAATSVA